MAGLPKKYAKMGFKKGWAAYKRAGGGKRKKSRTQAQWRGRGMYSRKTGKPIYTKGKRSGGTVARRRRTYRRKGWRRKAKSILPKTASGAIAALQLAKNFNKPRPGGGSTLIGKAMNGNLTGVVTHLLNAGASPNTWVKPALYAGVGWAARRTMGPGPRIIGTFRAW